MTERHGDRPDKPADKPAPTITGASFRTDLLILNTRQKSLQGGARTVDYKRASDRPAPTVTTQAGSFWQWERPATTVCADPRIPAPGYRTGRQRSLTPCVPAEDAAIGLQNGDEAIKLSFRDGLLLQGFPEDYPVQGGKTKWWEQVGNAVPPALAFAVVDALASVHSAETPSDGAE